MTKQEAINRAWALLEVLEALPDSSDILTAEARGYNGILPPLKQFVRQHPELLTELLKEAAGERI